MVEQMVLERYLALVRDSVASANSYLVQVNISDKSYMKVSAINYDTNYYSDDLETIPNREDVLWLN